MAAFDVPTHEVDVFSEALFSHRKTFIPSSF